MARKLWMKNFTSLLHVRYLKICSRNKFLPGGCKSKPTHVCHKIIEFSQISGHLNFKSLWGTGKFPRCNIATINLTNSVDKHRCNNFMVNRKFLKASDTIYGNHKRLRITFQIFSKEILWDFLPYITDNS